MAIQKVGVLGCGLMGSGIAQVAATAGYSTIVKEVADEFLKKGMASIDKSLSRLVEKGTITRRKAFRNSRASEGHDEVRRPCRLRHRHRSDH